MTPERSESEQPGSVTRWLPGLRRGEQQAIQAVWERYFGSLVRVAEGRLRGAPRRAGDGEDIAVDAFLSFCADARREGHFPDLSSRANLIRLLVCVTMRKAADFRAREGRRHAAVRGDSALGEAGFDVLAGDEPPPEFQAQVGSLLARLSEELRDVALLRLEGLTNDEIAARRGWARSTVERKVARIRGLWRADWDALHGADDGKEGES
jgi:DNA-directed RNA polymerase specialized sigma24 family protein